MSSRLAALTARRLALQVECDLRRGDVRHLYGDLEGRTARADRVIENARRFGPAIAVGGIALLIALGPGRALSLARRGLAIAVYASHARRMLS
ncbi:MAG: hypothetical protein FIB04_04520 [Gammaproteobacteria bacterium]|nr:hypothetical protein [Gammaproteobacteria bacterium]